MALGEEDRVYCSPHDYDCSESPRGPLVCLTFLLALGPYAEADLEGNLKLSILVPCRKEKKRKKRTCTNNSFVLL